MDVGDAETRFSEAQANEILRTAVRLAAPDSMTVEDLTRSAAQMGISEEELLKAEQLFIERETQQGKQREFRILQRNEFVKQAILYAFIAAAFIFVALRNTTPLLPFVGLAAYLGAVLFHARNHLLQSSDAYQRKFEEWEKTDDNYLTPEQAEEVVSNAVKHGIEIGSNRRAILKSLRSVVGYDSIRARQVLDAYLEEHPEIVEQLPR